MRSINERIRDAASAVITDPADIVADRYLGHHDRYVVFQVYESHVCGDDGIAEDVHRVYLHYFCPVGVNSLADRRALRGAIMADDGFAAPTITPASDEYSQHYVFEFEAAELEETEPEEAEDGGG